MTCLQLLSLAFRFQLAFMTMAIIGCLYFTSVNGLPTSVEEVSTNADGNETDWTNFLPSFRRQKRAVGCKSYRRAQLIRKLNKLGAKVDFSYGGYNRRYMAFNWKEAIKFPSLVPTVGTVTRNVSAIRKLPLRAPTRATTITSRANCHTSDNGLLRMCSACPAVTFLGYDRIPSYINEVTCGQSTCSFGVFGMCQNAVMYQQFLYKTGRCDPKTGYEELLSYTQAIRVCCECMVFPDV